MVLGGRVPRAIVTGGAGAIGEAIARGLTARGFEVAIACRDAAAGGRVVDRIAKATGSRDVHVEVVDLSLRSSVLALARRWQGPLDALVNNAATAPRRREETGEGIERQLATNVLSYLWMAEALEDALALGAPSRIVNVASYWAGDLDVGDLEFRRRRYDNDTAYRQSKQCNRMLTVAEAERLRPRAIFVNACHPGDVPSKLARDLGFGGHETPDQAAATPLLVATEPAGIEASGRYFEGGAPRACRFARDRAAIASLSAACAGYAARRP